MPGSSATHAIFFIVSVLVAVALAGVMYLVVMNFSEGLEDKSNRLVSDMETDFVIANGERGVPYEDSTLSIYVMNTGRQTLDPEQFLVFVDGSYRNITAYSYFDGETQWLPLTTVNLSVQATGLSEDEDHSVKLIHSNGNEDSMIFRLRGQGREDGVMVTIVSDSENVPYRDSQNLTILVQNSGDLEIDINSTSVLINGELVTIIDAKVEGNTVWGRSDIANFTVQVANLSSTETHRMKVVVQDGAQAAIDFKVKED